MRETPDEHDASDTDAVYLVPIVNKPSKYVAIA